MSNDLKSYIDNAFGAGADGFVSNLSVGAEEHNQDSKGSYYIGFSKGMGNWLHYSNYTIDSYFRRLQQYDGKSWKDMTKYENVVLYRTVPKVSPQVTNDLRSYIANKARQVNNNAIKNVWMSAGRFDFNSDRSKDDHYTESTFCVSGYYNRSSHILRAGLAYIGITRGDGSTEKIPFNNSATPNSLLYPGAEDVKPLKTNDLKSYIDKKASAGAGGIMQICLGQENVIAERDHAPEGYFMTGRKPYGQGTYVRPLLVQKSGDTRWRLVTQNGIK